MSPVPPLHPDAMRRPVNPAPTIDDRIDELAGAIRDLHRQIRSYQEERMRNASRVLSEYLWGPNLATITLPPVGSRCRVTRVLAYCANATITLQLKGGLNVPSWSIVLPTGLSQLSLGGSDDGGLLIESHDVLSLTTTGTAGIMSLAVFGERLADGYAY